MAKILKIYNYKDPILRTKCREIDHIESWVLTLADDMWMTMLTFKAVGLAANQVGYDYRMITINCPEYQGPMINPKITSSSSEVFHYPEDCLSMPGYEMDTGKRSKTVVVEFTDLIGDKQKVALNNFTSIMVQHAIDYLDGTIMTDYLEESLAKSR